MNKIKDHRIVILLIVIFAIGIAIIWGVANSTGKKLRAELLIQARIAAQAIDTKYVSSLSGSEKDLNKSSYQRIKNQMASMRKAIAKCRFLYLMGQRSDNKVFFFVDSLPPDSKDYASPGLVYDEVSDSYLRVFETNEEAVVGPVSDRWGTLITALVPLKDPFKGNMIAVLGMDVDANYWNKEVLSRCSFPFTVMLLFMLLILLLFSREKVAKSLRQSEERLKIAGQASYDMLYVWDVANDNLKWFGDIDSLLGYKTGEISRDIGAWLNLIHPEDRGQLENAVELHRTTTEPIQYEYRIKHHDGSTRYWKDKALPRLDKDGHPYKWIGVCTDITERKWAEEVLRESEEKYRTLVERSLQGVVIAQDDPVRLSFVNHPMEAIAGYTVEELTGRGPEELVKLIHPDDRERFFGNFRDRIAGRDVPPRAEYRLIHRNGETHWVEIYSSRIEYGNAPATLTVFLDTTDRKQAEKALKQNQHFLNRIIDQSPFSTWISDEKGTIIRCNTALERLLNISAEQLVGKYNVFEDKTAIEQGLIPKIRTVFENGKTANFSVEWDASEHGYKGGNKVHIEGTMFPIHDDRGCLTNVVNHWIDASDRKQAEQALRESEEKHRTLFETMIQGVIYQSADGSIISANKAAERILGLTFDQMQGRTSVDPRWKSIHEDGSDFPGDTHPAMMALKTGKVVSDVVMGVFSPKIGAHTWININAVPQFKPGENKPYQVYATFEDITERKAVEAEREKLQAQLTQAQKMEAVGRLAGGVAHDFNNMLSVIIGQADLALEDMDQTSPLFNRLAEIKNAGERSADLTRQLLAFARKQTVAPRVLDLNQTVAGMTRMLQRLIGEDIDLVWLPGENVWPVKVDPGQVDQILANLCVNARDAIADVGKVTIETGNTVFDEAYCSDHPGFLPGEYALLAFSDNGCGMDAGILENIFEPFFTTKETGQGTGLGLATVYGVVKQNNGFVNVYSEPGQGTTFRIYLPRHRAKADALPEKVRTRPTERGHETILLVEDEIAILRMTTQMLERLGYRVVAAGTPGEAIRLAQEHPGEIHLLMTDVVMPEMNGRELAKNILSLHPDLKRLFMSGYTANVIAHHGVLDEGVNFIQKPFSGEQLGEKVREALDEAIKA